MILPKVTRETKILSLLFLVVVGLIAYLSNLSVWVVDDYAYQHNFATDLKERIHTVGDIFESQLVHYQTWNGRFIAHFIVQFFVSFLGKSIFSIVNGFAYVLLAYLLLELSGAKKNLFSWIVVLLATLVCFNDLFAAANQINYIWMAVLVCFCLIVYFKVDDNVSTPMLIALFLFGVFAGNAHDAYNVPIGGALLIRHIIQRKTITVKQWVMFFGLGIGGLFLCLSPGTLSRTEGRCYNLALTIYNFVTSIKMPYILILLLFVKCRSFEAVKTFAKENSFWFFVIFMSIAFNFAVGIQINRQLFAMEIASIILSLKLLEATKTGKIAVGFVAVLTCWGYVQIASALQFEKNTYSEIENLYLKSDSGVVYYDIPYNDKCQWMTPCFYVHNNNPYNDKCITTFGLTVNYQRGLGKTLVVLPTVLREQNVENSVQDFGDGTFLLVQNKQNPADFYVQREYKLAGITKFKDEFKAEFDGDGVFENETNRVMFFHKTVPFINNFDVKIK